MNPKEDLSKDPEFSGISSGKGVSGSMGSSSGSSSGS